MKYNKANKNLESEEWYKGNIESTKIKSPVYFSKSNDNSIIKRLGSNAYVKNI